MIKTKYWVGAIVAVVLLCIGINIGRAHAAQSPVARVIQNGQIVMEIDLDLVAERREIPLQTEDGYNLICVEPGRICIEEADCPDLICVKQGWIGEKGDPIVCLPHGIVIEIESSSGVDAVVR